MSTYDVIEILAEYHNTLLVFFKGLGNPDAGAGI